MINFFSEHWKIMLIGLAGVVLGVFLNWYFGNHSNKKLLEKLTTELELLQEKANTTALSADELNQIQYLKGEIYILKFKCL